MKERDYVIKILRVISFLLFYRWYINGMLATGSVKINLVANLIVLISAYIYRNIANEPLKRLFFDSFVCVLPV